MKNSSELNKLNSVPSQCNQQSIARNRTLILLIAELYIQQCIMNFPFRSTLKPIFTRHNISIAANLYSTSWRRSKGEAHNNNKGWQLFEMIHCSWLVWCNAFVSSHPRDSSGTFLLGWLCQLIANCKFKIPFTNKMMTSI